MPFPNAENAVVSEAKLRDYLLNPCHPVGGPKAVWFESLGYSLDNWQDLVTDLLQLASDDDDFVAKPSLFGVKYEASGVIGRSDRPPALVVTVWIVEENYPPRLITAYPG
jgi:hypothetical protein